MRELLRAGKNYQIALAEDARLDDKLVCVKAIEYEAAHLGTEGYVAGRRAALRAELEFLTLPSTLLPEPFDWLEITSSPIDQAPEPVLVYEHQHGDTLFDHVRERAPRGMQPTRALRIWRELVRFAAEVHQHGYVFRDFDPRHIIIGLDDVIHVVGCGNAVKRDEKLNVFKMNTNPRYTAPEIRREISGRVVRPACDLYSLGCLLTFMLTGVEPMPRPESPLDAEAYDRLRGDASLAGFRLLIARCLQPLAQKRFARAEDLLAFCTPETLPSASTPDFGLLDLPTPWSGPEGMDNRALRSKLSPGPLLSQAPEAVDIANAPTEILQSPITGKRPTPSVADAPTELISPPASTPQTPARTPEAPRQQAAPQDQQTALEKPKETAPEKPPEKTNPILIVVGVVFGFLFILVAGAIALIVVFKPF